MEQLNKPLLGKDERKTRMAILVLAMIEAWIMLIVGYLKFAQ